MIEERELVLNRKDLLKPKRKYWIIKRTQDIILSSVALVVVLPIMLLIALIMLLPTVASLTAVLVIGFVYF